MPSRSPQVGDMVAVTIARVVRHLVVNMVDPSVGRADLESFRVPVPGGHYHTWVLVRDEGVDWWRPRRSATPVRFSPKGKA